MKYVAYTLLTLCAYPTAVAQEAANTGAPTWTYSVTPSLVSQYMFRGQLLDGASLQPAVESDYGNWSLGVWSSIPLSNKVPGQSDPELDPYGSYRWALNDATSVSPGFTWYTYPKAPTGQGFFRDTFEPNLALSYVLAGVTFTPKLYYDVVLRGATYEFGAAYTVALSAAAELDLTAVAGTYLLENAVNSSPDTRAWGNYWLTGVSLPIKLTKDSKLAVGFAYTEGTDAYTKQAGQPKIAGASAVGRGVVSISYSVTY